MCQIVLVVVIANYLVTSDPEAFLELVSADVLFCRFIAGTILHLSLLDEVTRGVHNLKFALNHPYLFQSWIKAATVGFLQAFIVLCVEFCNIEIILTSENPLDIVYNFVVLGIISEFDDFVYSSLRNESMKLLTEDKVTEAFLVIRHTTSKKCDLTESSGVEDDEGEDRPLKVQFGQRTCCN